MQFNLLEPGNLVFLALVSFHDFLLFYLILISLFVLTITIITLQNYIIGIHNIYLGEVIKLTRSFYQGLKISHYPTLEFIWTVYPSLILVNMAVPTFLLLYAMDLLIQPRFALKVVGNQWYWAYESNDFPWQPNKFAFDSYIVPETDLAEGSLRLLEVDNSLVLPTRLELRVLITSHDVLHSFAVPQLGIKLDAVPGRINQVPLFVEIPGVYYGQCSELCGPNHGFMPITLECT
jgi:cytochrome c oxidase subunit 2